MPGRIRDGGTGGYKASWRGWGTGSWASTAAPAAPLALIALAAAPFAWPPLRQAQGGASGPGLIAALGQTGRLQLAFGALPAAGLAIRP